MECKPPLVGRRICRFHQCFPAGDVSELARPARYRHAEGNGASSYDMGLLIDVGTEKHLPIVHPRRLARTDYARGTIGGVVGGVQRTELQMGPAQSSDQNGRHIIRSGTLEVIATDPLQAAEQLRNFATHLSGFVVSSKVSGSDGRAQWAQVTLRIPAEHFDAAGALHRGRLGAALKRCALDHALPLPHPAASQGEG
jgi:Domain of unknown function (DUF4349)